MAQNGQKNLVVKSKKFIRAGRAELMQPVRDALLYPVESCRWSGSSFLCAHTKNEMWSSVCRLKHTHLLSPALLLIVWEYWVLHAVGLINVSIRAKGKRVSEEVLGTTRMIIGNIFHLIVLDRSSGKFQAKHPHGWLESRWKSKWKFYRKIYKIWNV